MKRTGVNHNSSKSQQGKTNLHPVIALMDKLATRMNLLDKKIDSIRKENALEFMKSRKENDSFRKETAQEFKKSRRESKQDIQSLRKETAQELKKSRRESKQDIQSVRNDMAKYYFAAREENRIIADEHARTLTQTFTTMDGMAKDYSRWLYEKQFNDAELKRHSRAIDELKEKDAQKETALQDLQKRVVVLESANNGKPVSPSPQLKEQN
jgi:hypothetical protein